MIASPSRVVYTPASRAALVRQAEARHGLSAPVAPVNLAGPSAPTGEKGYNGLPAFGGQASSEIDHVAAWKLPARWATIREMSGDPDIAAVMMAIALPILATPLTVEPGGADDKDKAIAEFIERDLGNMTISLARWRAQVLLAPLWGNRIFEPVWQRGDDKRDHLRKLALRPSPTITRWHLDDHGGPDGVTQYNAATSKEERLGMDRLLAFVFGVGDLGLIGDPLSRAMYGPWYLKTQLAKIGAAAVERHGMGIPTLRYTGQSAQIRDRYESALMGIHAHHKAFLLLTEGVESMGDFALKGVEGSILSPVEQYELHRRAIYTVGLCPHLLLGADAAGSYALSADQSSNFLLSLEALTKAIEDTINTYLIPRMVGFNWAGVPSDRMPRVVHGTLARRDVKAWFESLALAVQSGVSLDADAASEMSRDLLGVTAPEAPEADIAPVADVNAPDGEDGEPVAPTQPGQAEALARGQWRGVDLASNDTRLKSVIMLEALGIAPNFVGMAARLDKGRDRIAEVLAPMQTRQARALRRKAEAIIKRGDPEELTAFLDDPANIPYQDEREAIEEELRLIYADGVGEVGDELGQQGVKASAPDSDRVDRDKALLAALALFGAKKLADRMGLAFGTEVLRQMTGAGGKAAGVDVAALTGALTGAPEKLLADIGARAANAAFGMGRGGAIEANAEAIPYAINTEVLDGKTCAPCREADGREVKAEDAGRYAPYADCEGGNLCRGQLIPVAEPSKRGAPIQTGDEIAADLPW